MRRVRGAGRRGRRGQEQAARRACRRGPAGRLRHHARPVLRRPRAARAGPGVRVAAQPGAAVRPRPARAGVGAGGRPPRAADRTPARCRRRARWPTPGSGTGSSRAWPGRCCPPGGPPCCCWTIFSGVTSTPWPGCSCCCTWARGTRCSWSPRPGWRRSTATPSSPRCCGRCARRARSPTSSLAPLDAAAVRRAGRPGAREPARPARRRTGCTPRPAATRYWSSSRSGRTCWTAWTPTPGRRSAPCWPAG